MKNFWQKVDRPFFALAPMFDVTDAAFRQMVVKYSKSDRGESSNESENFPRFPLVLFTEFVSADGLVSDAGRPKLLRELYYTEEERPIVAQIFGKNLANIETAVKLIKELKFDGVDINMGCPDRVVEKQEAGAALIKNPQLAQEIILMAKKVARDMPVSVKTRLGYHKIDYDWIKTILGAKPEAVTFHLRTRKELSKVDAHWEEAGQIAKLAHEAGVVVTANGDVKSIEQGRELAKKYDLDGVMIGRGALGKPWIFSNQSKIEVQPRLASMLEHSQLFWDLYGPTDTNQKLFHGHQKNFAVMRKYFKAYVSGFRGATALRAKLMQTQNPEEVKKIIKEFFD